VGVSAGDLAAAWRDKGRMTARDHDDDAALAAAARTARMLRNAVRAAPADVCSAAANAPPT
jgi:hypothetical protein